MWNRLIAFLLIASGLFCLGSGKRGQPVLISFHLETGREEWPKFAQAVKMGDPAQQFYFKLSPALTDADILWFYPFISEDQVTYGAAFKLKETASQRLTTLTGDPAFRGKLMGVHVQPIGSKSAPLQSYLQIDSRITDGTLVIWKGLTDGHLRAFSQRFPHYRDFKGKS
jgi:hypothetical protein